MLCEISVWGNFWSTWAVLTVLAFFMLMVMSGLLFYVYYANPTFEQWQYKSNPKYPSPLKVREEIITMTKGLLSASFCPSLALYLSQKGLSQAYCGMSTYSLGYHVFCFFFIWIGVDLWEFLYHRVGHTTDLFWKIHKAHHRFFNPSPFAVIADEWADQFARAAPLLVLPIVMPMNMDLIFFEFALFFYLYGTYLHWGYEFSWLDAHHPLINTAFQHYCHHAVSSAKLPYHTGFFFKIWDQIAGSMYNKDCFCAKCERDAGKRSFADWQKIEKPDYSVLLKLDFWLNPPKENVKHNTEDVMKVE